MTGSIFLSGSVLLVSDILLGMDFAIIANHFATTILLSIGLSGLSVGLSAWLPNFRETDPSKIVLGFGGTINMLMSLGYLVVMILVACGPLHFAKTSAAMTEEGGALPWWAFAGLPVAAAIAAVATYIPLKVGMRTLREMEF